MNKVTLIGRTTKEIELQEYGKGKDKGVYAKVCVAVRASKDNTDFIYCTLWGKTAEIAAEYVRKGDLVALAGRVASSSYDDEDGERHFRTDISINEIELVTSRREEAEDEETEAEEDYQPKKKKASRRSK